MKNKIIIDSINDENYYRLYNLMIKDVGKFCILFDVKNKVGGGCILHQFKFLV